MKRLSMLLIAAGLLFLYACHDVGVETADANKAVVEGYMIAGSTPTIKITQQLAYSSSDTVVNPINNLNVEITDGEVVFILSNTSDGIYQNNELQVEQSKTYYLRFIYNDKVVDSQTVVPIKPSGFTASATSIQVSDFTAGSGGGTPNRPEPVTLEWDNPDNDYYLVVVENAEADPTPIFDDDTTSTRPPRAFRNSPTQTNLQQLNPMSFSYYGMHRVILYRLNPEYATLYEDNGNSSLTLVTPPGNISGGLGIFTGISSDTIMVRVYK